MKKNGNKTANRAFIVLSLVFGIAFYTYGMDFILCLAVGPTAASMVGFFIETDD